MTDSRNIFRKAFKTLLIVFAIMFIIEFAFTASGHPIAEIEISGVDLEKDTLPIWLLRSVLSASLFASYFNYFYTVKIIKQALLIDRLPTVAVVLMTILFPLEILIALIFVLPNIFIYGIYGFRSRSLKEHSDFTE